MATRKISWHSTLARQKRVWSRDADEKQKRKAAADHLKRLRAAYKKPLFPKTGRPLSIGRIFLDRGRYGRFLEALTGKSDFGNAVSYLRDIGTIGPIIHGLLSVTAGRPHIKSKRRLVVETLRILPAGGASRFNSLVFATARYMYQNHQAHNTLLYDKRAESAVFEVFGELAKKGWKYGRLLDPSEPLAQRGKKYFRWLLRNDMLMNFGFLKENYSDEKMSALRHGLVGERVDELTEQQDLERLKFVSSIFGHGGEIATIEQAIKNSRQKKAHEGREVFLKGPHVNKAVQALITLQLKARNLDIGERNYFFRSVCSHYGINEKQVFEAAKSLYYNPKLRAERGRLADDRTQKLLKLADEAQAVYGFQPTKRGHGKKADKAKQGKPAAPDMAGIPFN